MAPTITACRVVDVRYPTSDTLKGSDPFHKKPDYSAPYIELLTDDPALKGVALVFTIGAGTDWIVYGINDLATLLVGLNIGEFSADPGRTHRRLLDHHQLRWLGDGGVFSMAVGGVMNALWDLAAKVEGLPMWRYLSMLPPERIVGAINWRHIRDALTPEEALAMLRKSAGERRARIEEFAGRGPEAYSTAAWSGLTDAQVREACRVAVQEQGMRSVKAKVGIDLADDRRRLQLMRDAVGPNVDLRVDANQIWDVNQAIAWMSELGEFGLRWIEEPTHPDDVLGYKKIRTALAPYGIGVAGGEHTKNPVLFKQLFQHEAIDYCQVDASRMSGLNDVLAVILMAEKYGVPVCPHGGGIGLCNYIQHLGAWDQIAVSGSRENRVVEWIDFLGEAMEYPVQVRDGYYVLPEAPGWGIELRPEFVERYEFPTGPTWCDRPKDKIGIRFEA